MILNIIHCPSTENKIIIRFYLNHQKNITFDELINMIDFIII